MGNYFNNLTECFLLVTVFYIFFDLPENEVDIGFMQLLGWGLCHNS